MIYLMTAGMLFGANPARTTDAETPALSVAKVASHKSEGRFVHKGDKQPWILLVDDDGSAGGGYPDLGAIWAAGLDVNYSGEYDVYEVMANGDGPDLATMQPYDMEAGRHLTGSCTSTRKWLIILY